MTVGTADGVYQGPNPSAPASTTMILARRFSNTYQPQINCVCSSQVPHTCRGKENQETQLRDPRHLPHHGSHQVKMPGGKSLEQGQKVRPDGERRLPEVAQDILHNTPRPTSAQAHRTHTSAEAETGCSWPSVAAVPMVQPWESLITFTLLQAFT